MARPWGPPAPARALAARGRAARAFMQPRRDHALLVVGDDERRGTPAAPRARRATSSASSSARGSVARVLAVGAHDLLVVRDDARLERGAAGRPGDGQRVLDARSRRAPRARARRPRRGPTTPASTAAPPSARTLPATLPAPPRWKLWPVTSTTGTGASGEMRATLPQRNSSSITSPTTSTRLPRMRRAAPARGASRERHSAVHGRRRLAPAQAYGSAVSSEHEHQDLGVAEIVFEQPGHHDRGRAAASAPAAAQRGPRRSTAARRASRSAAMDGDATHQSHQTRQGRPRSAAICSTLLCRCGWRGVRGLGPAVARVDRLDHAAAPARTRASRGSCRCRPATCSSGRGCSRRDGEPASGSRRGRSSTSAAPAASAAEQRGARSSASAPSAPGRRPSQPGVARPRDEERPGGERQRPRQGTARWRRAGQGAAREGDEARARRRAPHEHARRRSLRAPCSRRDTPRRGRPAARPGRSARSAARQRARVDGREARRGQHQERHHQARGRHVVAEEAARAPVSSVSKPRK